MRVERRRWVCTRWGRATELGSQVRSICSDLRSSSSLQALYPHLKQNSGSIRSCFNRHTMKLGLCIWVPFEKVKATLVVRCLQNIFISSWFFWGASMLKDVEGSSLKVKGQWVETARDRERWRRRSWGKHGAWEGRRRPGGSMLSMCQAPSQVLLQSSVLN